MTFEVWYFGGVAVVLVAVFVWFRKLDRDDRRFRNAILQAIEEIDRRDARIADLMANHRPRDASNSHVKPQEVSREPEELSRSVRIELRVDGVVHPAFMFGWDFIDLRAPFDCPPTTGEILMTIGDGSTDSWPVYLPNGIKAGQSHTRIEVPRKE